MLRERVHDAKPLVKEKKKAGALRPPAFNAVKNGSIASS
jgi:hypothetical protein